MKKNQIFYLIATVLLFLTEVCIALFIHDDFIRPYFGDFLVVILMYCFVRSFFKISVWRTAIFVLFFSYLIETLQYFNIIEALHLQQYKVLCIIIGTSFAWFDLLAYTLGIVCVLLVEKLLQSKHLSD